MMLALAACCAAQTRPAYTADSIVKASDYSPGPFAPNSVLTLFGSGLAYTNKGIGLTDSNVRAGLLPFQLANTQVLTVVGTSRGGVPVPLLYVDSTQINFLVPPDQSPGDLKLRVDRQGVDGPEVTITIAEAAPALFDVGTGFAIATHADSSLITPDSPAHPGEIVVLYGTGFGKTQGSPALGEIPHDPALLDPHCDLKVWLAGSPVDPLYIKYAGLTAASAGLYQINLELPGNVPADPQIRVEIAGQSSREGLKLAVR
jgi:uncharacterized protein (TIGR03437 family)